MRNLPQTHLADVTYYYHDASGNVLSVYQLDQESDGTLLEIFELEENHIYASQRIGIANRMVDMETPPAQPPKEIRELGFKGYELNSHTGNVMEVVSNRRLGTEGLPAV
ncbi:hypothetical protein JYT72_01640 [Crocinitomix catalasitica]|nr:hypothetical protein [Crocinitomix catalasitica]